MWKRQEKLLKLIVEKYIETAEPVGSKLLAEKGGLGVSGATLRNDMREMESVGWLTHPHTSAGRMPTETGYRYYVDHLITVGSPQKSVAGKIDRIMLKENSGQEGREFFKRLAKYVSEQCDNAAIVLENNFVYYTGFSALFNQPEFKDYNRVVNFSAIFDQFEHKAQAVIGELRLFRPCVFIGKDNPFGKACALIASKLEARTVLALLGPIRMDYKKNLSIIEYVNSNSAKSQAEG